jgi:dTDP-4-dehydrorhamnose 3,5-epimerase
MNRPKFGVITDPQLVGKAMRFERLDIESVRVLMPGKRGDSRGFFSETFRKDVLATAGINAEFVQDNHVYSAERGVLRGLHFQIPPHPQGKLVRCIRGSILDVCVDIRAGSPTYGHHVAVELSAANWKQLWIPSGFAHGYVTLEPDTEVIYKVTDYWAPDCERAIAWNDTSLGIDWRLTANGLILSEKDKNNPTLQQLETFFHFDQRDH